MLIAPDAHGTLDSIDVNNALAPEAEFTIFRKSGDQLTGFTNSGDCLGQVVVTADSLNEALETLDTAESAVNVKLRAIDA